MDEIGDCSHIGHTISPYQQMMQLVCHVVRTISTLSESDHYDALILFCNRTIRRVLEDFRDSVREREREISECLSRQVTDWN